MMNDKKLRKVSFWALFSGYSCLALFVWLVIYGIVLKTTDYINSSDEDVVIVDDNISIIEKPENPLLHYDTRERVVLYHEPTRPVTRGVILDSDDDDIVVVRDDHDHTLFLDNDRVDRIHINDETRFGDTESTVIDANNDTDVFLNNRRVHNNNKDVHLNDYDDLGILDRRLNQRLFEDDEDVLFDDRKRFNDEDLDISDKRDSEIGLDDRDGFNFEGFRPVLEGDDEEISLDIDGFNIKDSEFGLTSKKGNLYAYSFPSQGVGAGIGNAGIGAAAGFAGIGAGIGEAVLDGKTVPTLGGVGTSPINPMGLKPTPQNDPDNDGLPSEVESRLGTNPLNPDTDGDGAPDGKEVESYSNPIDASSTPSSPGSNPMPQVGGVGGMVNGAGAGPAAGLVTGRVEEMLGLGAGCSLHGGGCDGHHGHGGHGNYNFEHLPENGALHIMIHVDGSGSLLATRRNLEDMKNGILKQKLLPYYNNDENLYNKRVTIVDSSKERVLDFFAQAAQKNNVLAVAFQDEASPEYHLPVFNKKPQSVYKKDLHVLKNRLNGYNGMYRGIIFQVDRGRTFSKSFKEMVEHAWNGTGYLEKENLSLYHRDNKAHDIRNKSGIIFSDEYHAKSEEAPEYYMNLLFNASKRVGIDLNIYGGGLKDGKQARNYKK